MAAPAGLVLAPWDFFKNCVRSCAVPGLGGGGASLSPSTTHHPATMRKYKYKLDQRRALTESACCKNCGGNIWTRELDEVLTDQDGQPVLEEDLDETTNIEYRHVWDCNNCHAQTPVA